MHIKQIHNVEKYISSIVKLFVYTRVRLTQTIHLQNTQLPFSDTNLYVYIFSIPFNRLLDSLVREVPGSIPSQGPRHTKDIIKMVPVVPLFSTQY